MKQQALAFLALLVALISGQYSCDNPCYGNMCCSIPSDNTYVLTTFCDSSTACGPGCSDYTYFAADSQRFGCGKNLTICAAGTTNCVGAIVIDAGPNISVEEKAGMAIIDASAQVCSDLFGMSSCGWSDGKEIVAYLGNPPKMGPFVATPEQMRRLVFQHQQAFSQKLH
uniref:Uncharacterized protein n=1 Tax=Arcella intermedia TaxID=1963864 RepID=A0A6B2LLT8_9EUKA